jgi:hypothetical protein
MSDGNPFIRERILIDLSKICAGSSNPKASGLCGGAKGAMLWKAPTRNETEEAIQIEIAQSWLQNPARTNSTFEGSAAEECNNADVPEKGHRVNGFAKSYNADAFYTKAAACYIYKKLKSSIS